MRTDPRLRILVTDQDQCHGRPVSPTDCPVALATYGALREALGEAAQGWTVLVDSDLIEVWLKRPGDGVEALVGTIELPEAVVEAICAYDLEHAPLVGVAFEATLQPD